MKGISWIQSLYLRKQKSWPESSWEKTGIFPGIHRQVITKDAEASDVVSGMAAEMV